MKGKVTVPLVEGKEMRDPLKMLWSLNALAWEAGSPACTLSPAMLQQKRQPCSQGQVVFTSFEGAWW